MNLTYEMNVSYSYTAVPADASSALNLISQINELTLWNKCSLQLDGRFRWNISDRWIQIK